MSDDSLEDEDLEPGMIGVGMGGSCPNCRAPIDLGQEFCLECGAPIRFTPKQRQKRRRSTPSTTSEAPVVTRRGGGFPWVPFLIVLVLVGGGVALALVDDDETGKKGKETVTTDSALPSITNEAPTTEASDTTTITLEDCDPTRPLDGSQPAIADDDESADDPNSLPDASVGADAIPSFEDENDPLDTDGFADATPSTLPEAADPGSTPAVTVDQDGMLCPSTDAADASTSDPLDGSSSSPGAEPPSSSTASGDWPSGKDGWTVIIAGYRGNESRAQQRAADVQEDGFEDAGVLFSSDFRSLCPGFYVVFSGVFDSESEATRHGRELASRADYAGTYAREIRTDGPAATGCKTTS